MKKNRKGFTLIELLAVLVVLAILALITTPIVLNIIKNAREGADERSADAYVRAVENAVANCMTKYPNIDITTDGNLTLDVTNNKVKYNNEECSTVDYKGNKEITTTGTNLTITENNRKLEVGGGETTFTIGTQKFAISEGKAIELKTYKLGEEVKYNGIKFYVITDNVSSVTLLKEEPLNIDEVNTYGAGHLNKYTYDSQGTAYNVNGYGGMAYYTSETCGYVNGSRLYSGCENNYADSDIKYAVDEWAAGKTNDSDLVVDITGYKARLLTYDELQNKLGYSEYSKTESTPEWVYNSEYWYWTMSPYPKSSVDVWGVYGDGVVSNNYVGYRTVVRPVITVLKSKVQKL